MFGITYSFGVFVAPMAAEFRASHTATSVFFSATGVTFYLFGALTGHLSDRFGPRIVVAAGGVVLGGGLVLTALMTQVWAAYLTYGLGIGLGAACCYVPTLASVGGWFGRRRNLALGIAAAGTGSGMVVVPPLAGALIQAHGWRLADIVVGVASAVVLSACAFVVRAVPQKASGGWSMSSVLFSRDFVLLYASWVLGTTALFVPLVFLPSFALGQGAGPLAASALISVLGGLSILGRLGVAGVRDRSHPLQVFRLAALVMGASYLVWLFAPAYWGLVLFTVVLGLGYGVRISLVPIVLIERFGLERIGAITGIFFTGTGVAAVLGPVVSGALVDSTSSYRWAIAFALVVGLLGFLAIIPLGSRKEGATAVLDDGA